MAKKLAKVVTTIRLDSDVDKKLNEAVRDLRRSKNSIVQEIIIQWLKERKA